MNTFFIVGAQFDNKGAQSMLFITIDQLRKKFPGCKIYCACTEKIDNNIYKFDCIYYSNREKNITLGINPIKNILEATFKDTVKLILGRYNNLLKYGELKSVLNNVDMIFDISGYNLGDKWDLQTHETYLNNIRLAQKFNIPIVLLPQSFGPFNYDDNIRTYLMDELQNLLKYPKMIFARETEGYNLLTKQLGLTNVKLSSDLVLQNQGVEMSNILKNSVEIDIPEIPRRKSVGIIPNSQCFAHGNKTKILELYKKILDKLLLEGLQVYIFRHSREDLNICYEISELVDDKTNVHVVENDFSCFEYDQWIKNFEFIVGSRFHALVHAYRQYIPCILLGWATKYESLANKLNQDKYVFDITKPDFNSSQVVNAVDCMIVNCENESKVIKNYVEEIQKYNCFDQIESWIK